MARKGPSLVERFDEMREEIERKMELVRAWPDEKVVANVRATAGMVRDPTAPVMMLCGTNTSLQEMLEEMTSGSELGRVYIHAWRELIGTVAGAVEWMK